MKATLIGILLGVAFLPGWTVALGEVIGRLGVELRVAAITTALGAMGMWKSRGGRLEAINTINHELSHVVAVLLTGGEVDNVWASRDHGGEVVHRGGWRLFLALAPYSVPWMALVAMAVEASYRGGECSTVGAGIIGGFIGWHGASAVESARRNFYFHRTRRTDFHSLGTAASLVWIGLQYSLLLGILVAFVDGGLARVGQAFERAWAVDTELWLMVRSWAQTTIARM